jgi:hypothetical protein
MVMNEPFVMSSCDIEFKKFTKNIFHVLKMNVCVCVCVNHDDELIFYFYFYFFVYLISF